MTQTTPLECTHLEFLIEWLHLQVSSDRSRFGSLVVLVYLTVLSERTITSMRPVSHGLYVTVFSRHDARPSLLVSRHKACPSQFISR